jgi:hypothetical protein
MRANFLLLSVPGVFHARHDAGTSVADIAETYDVTTQLVEYRIKITGPSNLYQNRYRVSRDRITRGGR